MSKSELQTMVEQRILMTGPVRPRSMADAARVRAALRAARAR
jgi:hypothetical protein